MGERKKALEAAFEAAENSREHQQIRLQGMGDLFIVVHCIHIPYAGVLPPKAPGAMANEITSVAALASGGVATMPELNCPAAHLSPDLDTGFGVDPGPFFFPLPTLGEGSNTAPGEGGGTSIDRFRE